ncbi:hypothetical protein GCM10011341_35050 [Frigidibacter albus]|nr:hypothetical protein GCM10011341_35050 [Frigidibacter albus]
MSLCVRHMPSFDSATTVAVSMGYRPVSPEEFGIALQENTLGTWGRQISEDNIALFELSDAAIPDEVKPMFGEDRLSRCSLGLLPQSAGVSADVVSRVISDEFRLGPYRSEFVNSGNRTRVWTTYTNFVKSDLSLLEIQSADGSTVNLALVAPYSE